MNASPLLAGTAGRSARRLEHDGDEPPDARPDAHCDAYADPQDQDSGFDELAEREQELAAEQIEQAAVALRSLPASGPSGEQLAQWIAAIVEHDERALAALYDATVARVYGIVLRVVRRPALAEEVVEDTFFQVWRQAVRFDAARGKPLTWLLAMARTRAIDALRREARFQHDSLDDDSAAEVHDPAPVSDDLLEVARHHADLHRAMLLLAAQPRQLVALAFFRGLSHEEISAQTLLPLGTVKSQIRRALITLRQILGDGAPAALAA